MFKAAIPIPFLRPRIPQISSYRTYRLKSTISTTPNIPDNSASFWQTLRASQLKDLAIAVGASVSGTKSIVSQSITDVVEASVKEQRRNGEMRILSIDMGIRNLAYAFVIVPAPESEKETSIPIFFDWKRLDVSETQRARNSEDDGDESPPSNHQLKSNPYSPSNLAPIAHNFVSSILSTHNPTHILIERQRFRSGGSSAVLEWSLRVGVFEGMLHALFLGLAIERDIPLDIRSIDPGRVTRFWLSKYTGSPPENAAAVKKFKVEVAARILASCEKDMSLINTAPNLHKDMIMPFLHKHQSRNTSPTTTTSTTRKSPNSRSPEKLDKIDDLADSFLSVMTWLEWQKAAKILQQHTQAQKQPRNDFDNTTVESIAKSTGEIQELLARQRQFLASILT
ncbi:hypothetical protein UCRPC4_g02709 [Phaeomoniella chlamydospora]|uniref:Mitochondrial resolvase Ydc2 catalytic domain-containing protein n=1 Tax=Phaeomoniella chlamydospora TaxID=158046 RepID=A0A0G2EP76_PHACM|nr:hypothetical protein UCRPC4_g02709 [Phaeomoniella chlamydospora]